MSYYTLTTSILDLMKDLHLPATYIRFVYITITRSGMIRLDVDFGL